MEYRRMRYYVTRVSLKGVEHYTKSSQDKLVLKQKKKTTNKHVCSEQSGK